MTCGMFAVTLGGPVYVHCDVISRSMDAAATFGDSDATYETVGSKASAEMVRELREKRTAVISIDQASLDEVTEVDRPLIQNVIYAILACKHPDSLCTSWGVTCTATHYVISGMLPMGEFDVSLVDMELIHSISPLRISGISIVNSQDKNKLVIKVLNHMQRVQLTQADVVFTQKRRRQWM